MNRIMYIALACASIFLLICAGIRYKSNIAPIEAGPATTKTAGRTNEQLTGHDAVADMINKTAKQEPEKRSSLPHAIKGPVLALYGLKNLVKNPSANNGSKDWTTVRDVTVEPMKRNNPAFTLRNGGRLKQKVALTNADMQFIVVGANGSVNRVNSDKSDPAGLPLLRIYFEDRFSKSNTDQSTEIIMTRINENGWGQIGVVKQIPENTRFLHLELYQAKGKTSLNGRTTRFDDICVSIARNEEAGGKMLQSYISQAEAFLR